MTDSGMTDTGMTGKGTIRTVVTALALIASTSAAAATTPCLTQPEATAVAAFAMPSLLEEVARTCRPHLAADGFLAIGGPAMIGRYAAGKDAAWPLAKAAFLKIGAQRDPGMARLASALPDSAVKPMVEGLIGKTAAQSIKPADCATVETVASLVDPLPSENATQLLGLLASLASDRISYLAAFKLCPLQQRQAADRGTVK